MSTERDTPAGTGHPAPSTRERLRDIAIACFAAQGIGATSLRSVAAAADVAPSLLVHYFGTRKGLRAACDEHVATLLRQVQDDAGEAGLRLDPLATLRGRMADTPVLAYLARSLVEPSPESDALVDQVLADSVDYLAGLEAKGLVTPSADPRTRAVLLAFWSLGALALHRQLERTLGVDMTDPASDPQSLARYATATLELFGPGLLTPAMAEHLQQAYTTTDQETP